MLVFITAIAMYLGLTHKGAKVVSEKESQIKTKEEEEKFERSKAVLQKLIAPVKENVRKR